MQKLILSYVNNKSVSYMCVCRILVNVLAKLLLISLNQYTTTAIMFVFGKTILIFIIKKTETQVSFQE